MAGRRHAADANQLPLDFESSSRERHAMLTSALTITGTLKLERLARYVMSAEEKYGDPVGEARDVIGARLGMCGKTVRNWLARLERAGIVRIVTRQRERGGCRTNLLSIDWTAVRRLAVDRHTDRPGGRPAVERPERIANRPEHFSPRPEKPSAPLRNTSPEYASQLNTTTTKALPHAPAGSEPRERNEVEDFLGKCRRLLPAPSRLAEAVDAALAAGCTLEQLRERATWFRDHQHHWASEFRPGVIYRGFHDATPDTPANQGWPYQR